MNMYNGYSFNVEAVHPSALPKYESGHASSERRFRVPCLNAEEFCLRLLGKFYEDDYLAAYTVPNLPAPYPFYNFGGTVLPYGRLNLVATAFTIEPVSGACFNVERDSEDGTETNITDPTQINQIEKYFYDNQDELNQCDCDCIVTIKYEENPCDCLRYDLNAGEWVAHSDILPGTCISVERNPAYEMFTLPNGNLIWEGVTDNGSGNNQLKADSYAYKVIPKADIIVSWHNVPLNRLCEIENHLASFRGCVNDLDWGAVLSCDIGGGCTEYEPETILFIDWQEDRSRRTDAFGGQDIAFDFNMNTTTLKLIFKQKRILVEANLSNSRSDDNADSVYGWNHLFMDKTEATEIDVWTRVLVASTLQPLFTLKSFSDIMYPS